MPNVSPPCVRLGDARRHGSNGTVQPDFPMDFYGLRSEARWNCASVGTSYGRNQARAHRTLEAPPVMHILAPPVRIYRNAGRSDIVCEYESLTIIGLHSALAVGIAAAFPRCFTPGNYVKHLATLCLATHAMGPSRPTLDTSSPIPFDGVCTTEKGVCMDGTKARTPPLHRLCFRQGFGVTGGYKYKGLDGRSFRSSSVCVWLWVAGIVCTCFGNMLCK